MEEHDKAIKNGWETSFGPERPWHSVFDELVTKEKDYWDKEQYKPCFNVSMGIKKQEDYIQGDALTSLTPHHPTVAAHLYPGTDRSDITPIRFPKRPAPATEVTGPPAKTWKK